MVLLVALLGTLQSRYAHAGVCPFRLDSAFVALEVRSDHSVHFAGGRFLDASEADLVLWVHIYFPVWMYLQACDGFRAIQRKRGFRAIAYRRHAGTNAHRWRFEFRSYQSHKYWLVTFLFSLHCVQPKVQALKLHLYS
jgi:hypothetical protein